MSLLVACLWQVQRHRQEQEHRSVQMVLDFNALVESARSQGRPWKELLREYQSWGVGALALAELHIEELESYGICGVYSGVTLGAMTGLGCREGPRGIAAQMTYLVQWNQSGLLDFSKLMHLCQDGFGAPKVRVFPGPLGQLQGARVIEVAVPLRYAQQVGICFPEWGVAACGELGLDYWLRPENKGPNTQQSVRAAWTRLKQRYQPQGVIFGGASNEVVGYGEPQQLEETAACLREFAWKVGLIELPKATQQKGIETLVRQLPEQVVRVFTVPPAQQAPLKPERAAQMYSLAARERNLTLLYLRPYAFDATPDKGFEQANQHLFTSVSSGLRQKGLLGKAAVFQRAVEPDRVSLALMSLASLAGLWLTALSWQTFSTRWVWGSLLLWAGLNLALASVHVWAPLMALATACSASWLACLSQFPRLRQASGCGSKGQMLLLSTLSWLSMLGLALAGAFIATGFLQATSYKLGLDIFRGVKVVTVIMPLLITLAWMATPQERGYWLGLAKAPLKLYQILALGLLAVGGMIYTMRTGNMAGTDVGDSLERERYLRMVLDQILGVRPRFKEFLLAHPALLTFPLWLSWGRREAAALALLLGATGICGQLDTFAHVHTPLQVSLIRCLLGALLGWLLGCLLVGILLLLAKVSRWVQKKAYPDT